MELFFEEIKFLTRFYGCNVFEKTKKPIEEMGESVAFYLEVKKRGIAATVHYYPQSKKYVLIEGSLISSFDASCSKKATEIRKELISDPQLCKHEGNLVKVIQNINIPVESGLPSLPAEVITGTSMKGTKAFKNKEGKSFIELFPKE